MIIIYEFHVFASYVEIYTENLNFVILYSSSVVEDPDCNHEIIVVYASEDSYFLAHFLSKATLYSFSVHSYSFFPFQTIFSTKLDRVF